MKKRLIGILLVCCLLVSLALPLGAAAAETAQLVVSTESAKPGEEVTVSVSTKNNPGVFAFVLGFEYDSAKLEYLGSEDGEFTGWVVENGGNAVWIGDEDSSFNGVILKLKFKVLDGASGTAKVNLICAEDGAANYNEELVAFTTVAGGVEIKTEQAHTHSYTDKVTAPTCTEKGYTTHTCSCGDSYVDSYVDALGHNYKDGVCTVCGAKDAGYVPPHTHSYTDKVTAPTCTEKGYTTHTCSCGDSYVDSYVDALGHNTEIKNAKTATCTVAGYTGDEVCTVCGATVKTGTATAALGHNYKDGFCTVCGAKDPSSSTDPGASYTSPFNGITYTFKNGVLTVSGTGECYDDWYENSYVLDSYANEIKKVVIEEGISGIGVFSFLACSSLESVSISSTVEDIKTEAFSPLTKITVASGNKFFCSVNGALYNKDKTELICVPRGTSGSFAVPDGVKTIGSWAFKDCTKLESVSIPVSVTSIAAYPAGILWSDTFPGAAFTNCTALTDVYYAGTEAQWKAISIEEGNDCLTNATIHYGSTPTPTPTGKFTDVADTAYYAKAVNWAVERNITGGYNDNTFRPMNICTRAQIVTFIWRSEGCPEPVGTAKGFTDVKEGTYYYKAVLWAAEKGITGGFNDGGFHPDELVTRAQAMTFLWRAAGCPAVPAGAVNTFKDVTTSNYFYNAVLWAVSNGVTGGYDANTFGSMDGCTRAQIVTFLYRCSTATGGTTYTDSDKLSLQVWEPTGMDDYVPDSDTPVVIFFKNDDAALCVSLVNGELKAALLPSVAKIHANMSGVEDAGEYTLRGLLESGTAPTEYTAVLESAVSKIEKEHAADNADIGGGRACLFDLDGDGVEELICLYYTDVFGKNCCCMSIYTIADGQVQTIAEKYVLAYEA